MATAENKSSKPGSTAQKSPPRSQGERRSSVYASLVPLMTRLRSPDRLAATGPPGTGDPLRMGGIPVGAIEVYRRHGIEPLGAYLREQDRKV
jgi:hypothetical protein